MLADNPPIVIPDRSPVRYRLSWDPDDNLIACHVPGDNSVSTNDGITPNIHWTDDLRTGSNKDEIAQRWGAAIFPQSHSLQNGTPHTYACLSIDADAAKMLDLETGANIGKQRDVYAEFE